MKRKGDLSSIKMIDFGFSQKVERGTHLSIPNGTLLFLAPEMLDQKYDFKADVWSVGVFIYFMISGIFPFQGGSKKETIKKIYSGMYTFRLQGFMNCSFEAKDLISKLLVRNPEQRYTSENALHHPWVQW